MSLLTTIQNDLVAAQKNKEELKVSTLRFLLSSVKNREIELRPAGKTLDDEEVLSVISKQIKQRRESIVEFEKGNRPDLVEKETAELKILESYLPEQFAEEEVKKLVEEAINESGAASIADMGKVMALLMPKVKGKADGSLVSRLVKDKLTPQSGVIPDERSG